MEDLPYEIILKICEDLDTPDVLRLSEVCTHTNPPAKDKKLWKRLFKKNFPNLMFRLENHKQLEVYSKSHWLDIYKHCYKEQIRRFRETHTNLGQVRVIKFPSQKLESLINASIQLARIF